MYESKWCIFLLRALVSEVSYFAKQFDCNLKLFVGYKKPICLAMWHRVFMLKLSFQETSLLTNMLVTDAYLYTTC